MALRSETMIDTSQISDINRRPSKRFRPSVQCGHIDKKNNNEQCSADGFMECVHCDRICCLHHITQHQDELREMRDSLVEEASEAYLSLSEMQVTDSREQLQANLALWKKRMLAKIERIHGELLADIERSFVRVTADFELKKKLLANEFDTSVSTKLERLSNKCDFYPHELEELRLSLDEMYSRVREARASMINIDFGNSQLIPSSLFMDDDSFELNDDEIEVPRIITQTKPDIERVLNGSFIRQFLIDISSGTPLLFDTSNKQLLICNTESNTLQLFNHEQQIGGGIWSTGSNESPLVTCISWSVYLDTFLVLCSQSLHALNCSREPYNTYQISQITPIDGKPMKYVSIHGESMLIKHGNGSFIDHWTLKTMTLIKRWSKIDLYPFEQIEIHRIELYSNFSLAMNIELDDSIDVLDIIHLNTMQRIRRIDHAYLVLYLPLTNYWIIKKKQDPNDQTTSIDLCLLDTDGQVTRLNVSNREQIDAMRLFGKQTLLVASTRSEGMQMQLYHIDNI